MDKKTEDLIKVVKNVLAAGSLAPSQDEALQEALNAFEHDETRQILGEIREAMDDSSLINYLTTLPATSRHKVLCAAIDAWLEKHPK